MIRIAAVSYLNTRPFLAGIEAKLDKSLYSIQTEVPAKCAQLLENDVVDIALIPVGSMPDFEELRLMSNYCIGADGFVDSVLLCSRKPLEEAQTVFMDPSSRTSNGLAKILFHHYWKKKVAFKDVTNYFDQVADNVAVVIIGDTALQVRDSFENIYDLAYIWKEWCSLPFVFAVWAYKPQNERIKDNISKIAEAFDYGINHLDSVAQTCSAEFNMPTDEIAEYFKYSINYRLTQEHKEGLNRYLQELCALENLTLPKYIFEY
ncbi:MAG: menaquinone biosynthesis protein [Bacteroidia bacterium]|nr:menaquinone biosynthesis protein [Bacteroidia bacterium]